MTSMRRALQSTPDTSWLFVWAASVLAATLFPFDFDAASIDRNVLAVSAQALHEPLDLLLNVFLFVPLGVLLARMSGAWPVGSRFGGVIVGASALGFSLAIESLQALLPSRDSSLVDVGANALGAVLGYYAYGPWGSHVRPPVARLRARASPACRGAVMVSASLSVLLLSGGLQYGARLSNWDHAFYLLVGNEYTGERPWRGRVLRLGLSAAATPAALVDAFAAGHAGPVRRDPLVELDFSRPTWRTGTGAFLPPFAWAGAAEAPTPAGLEVSRGAWLQTAMPVPGIAARIGATNEFTLRVVCASAAADQRGPARIVSYSIDTMRRNFTVGQEGPDLVVRLRTPNTGPNGDRVPLVVQNVFSSPAARDILITYSGGTLHAAVQGTNRVHRLAFTPGVSLASAYVTPLPRHQPYLDLVYYGCVFLLQVSLLAWFAQRVGGYLAFGLPCVVTLGVALEATLAWAAPRPIDWANLGAILSVGAVILFAFGTRLCYPAPSGRGACCAHTTVIREAGRSPRHPDAPPGAAPTPGALACGTTHGRSRCNEKGDV